MKIEILDLKRSSLDEDEYITLIVRENANLGNYVLFDKLYVDGNPTPNKFGHIYWFSAHDMKKGDVIILYTKEGKDYFSHNTSGSKIYVFYWNLSNSIWNNPGDSAVLFELNEWRMKKVS